MENNTKLSDISLQVDKGGLFWILILVDVLIIQIKKPFTQTAFSLMNVTTVHPVRYIIQCVTTETKYVWHHVRSDELRCCNSCDVTVRDSWLRAGKDSTYWEKEQRFTVFTVLKDVEDMMQTGLRSDFHVTLFVVVVVTVIELVGCLRPEKETSLCHFNSHLGSKCGSN